MEAPRGIQVSAAVGDIKATCRKELHLQSTEGEVSMIRYETQPENIQVWRMKLKMKLLPEVLLQQRNVFAQTENHFQMLVSSDSEYNFIYLTEKHHIPKYLSLEVYIYLPQPCFSWGDSLSHQNSFLGV